MTDDKEKKADEAVEKPAPAKEAVTIPFGGRKRPAAQPQAEPMADVAALAKAAGMPDWELAALRRAKGWAPGKQVTGAVFTAAVAALRGRRQGGGRIGN